MESILIGIVQTIILVVTLLIALHFYRLSRSGLELIDLITPLLLDSDARQQVLKQGASEFFQIFKQSVKGEKGQDTQKRSRINEMIQETITQEVIPAMLPVNPLVGKILMKILGDSPVGDYLDENPEDFPLVMEVLGNIAATFMQGQENSLASLIGGGGASQQQATEWR